MCACVPECGRWEIDIGDNGISFNGRSLEEINQRRGELAAELSESTELGGGRYRELVRELIELRQEKDDLLG